MAIYRVLICSAFLALVVFSSLSPARSEEGGAEVVEEPAMLTLDASNFSETVAKYPFIVVVFCSSRSRRCKRLAPEFEKVAKILSKQDPPVLAKVDAKRNKELASKFEVRRYPTLKLLRNQGNNIQEYDGPTDVTEDIVEYLKKQAIPASVEIKSSEDLFTLIKDEKIYIVAVFPDYSHKEFKNFMEVAEKLRSDYNFGHTLDAKLLPHGDSTVSVPVVRLFRTFDEPFVDFQDFHVDALENFIKISSVPKVTIFDNDPSSRPFLKIFFDLPHAKAMLFLNFNDENFGAFKSKYYEVAERYKGKKISFLIGDLDASRQTFQFYGLKEEQVPLIFLQEPKGQNYLEPNVGPDEIATWVEAYLGGYLTPVKKSEPIPEVNNEPVKVVVADSLQDVVFKSGKNVLLEFYIPRCGHCKKLAPILKEVALSFQNDDDVVIAKMDATANDVPNQLNVKGYPTMYFSSASGKLVQYDGDNTKKDIIDFTQKNKDAIIQDATIQKDTTAESESLKDEL